MSEPWQSRAQLPPLLRPEMMIGAVSPLWGYFASFAMLGMGWWCATHWARTPAFEVLVRRTVDPAFADAAELHAAAAAADALAADALAAAPVGGESAPVGVAVLAAEPALAAELAPEPVATPVVVAETAEPQAAVKPDAAQPQPEPEPATKPQAAGKAVFAVGPDARPARSRKPREAESKPH